MKNVKNKITIIDHQLWYNLHLISDEISKHERNAFLDMHLTKEQSKTLINIAYLVKNNKKSINIVDLVPLQNRSPESISLLIDRMVKKGLLKKVRNNSDRRTVYINLTPLGKTYLKNAFKPTTDLIKKLFSTWSDKERDQLLILSDKLISTLGFKIPNITKNIDDEERFINFINTL